MKGSGKEWTLCGWILAMASQGYLALDYLLKVTYLNFLICKLNLYRIIQPTTSTLSKVNVDHTAHKKHLISFAVISFSVRYVNTLRIIQKNDVSKCLVMGH